MKTAKLLAVLVIAALLMSLAGSVVAAPPADNPGKGPPMLREFIHYAKGHVPDVFPVTTEPAGSELEGWLYDGYHWSDANVLPGEGITYWVNLKDSGDDGYFLNATSAASQTWVDDVGSYWKLTNKRETIVGISSLKRQMDELNVVGWAKLPPGWIAVTYIWYYSESKEIFECDMAFNTGFAWATEPYADKMDVQNIATHEFGHFLCLEDLYKDINTDKTMYGYSAYGEIKKRTLEASDETGIRYIYPGAVIYGTVSDFDTSDAIEGAAVSTDVGGYTDTTDANGFYCLDGVAPGSYTVTAFAEGYDSTSTDVTVSSTADIKLLDFALTELVIDTGSIDGTVTVAGTEPAEPIADATVTVEETNLSGITNTEGYYLIEDVPVETYTVTASADGYESQPVTDVTVTKDITTTVDFALTELVIDTMHVADIEMSWDSTTRGPNIWYKAIATVEIHDASNTLVDGATVYGTWTGAYSGTVYGTWTRAYSGTVSGTTVNGTVTLESGLVKGGGTFTFTVDNVTKDGWTYDSAANVETSDSITVL